MAFSRSISIFKNLLKFRHWFIRTKDANVDVRSGCINKLEDAKKFFQIYLFQILEKRVEKIFIYIFSFFAIFGLSAADKSTLEIFIHKIQNLRKAIKSCKNLSHIDFTYNKEI